MYLLRVKAKWNFITQSAIFFFHRYATAYPSFSNCDIFQLLLMQELGAKVNDLNNVV